MSAVTVEHLSYAYDGTNVLSNISFEIEEKSFFTIIGPNGSGKSTLMKIMANILRSRTGRVIVSGKNIAEYSRRAFSRHTAYVPQSVSDQFPFTVEEIVSLGRSPHQGFLGMYSESDKQKVSAAMETTRISSLGDRRIDQVSGGERQRVFLARAICQEPDILLLDEPASALDLAHQVQLMDLLEQLKQTTGITIVMVSHDINLAAMYANAMVLIKNGEVLCSGPPESVLEPDILKSAFGCRFLMDKNPLGNFPRIFPVPARYHHLV